jgi:AraC-like DNA-binding protein
LLQRYVVLSKGHFFGLPATHDDATAGFRMMCFSIVHSENLREAIERAAQFYELFANPAWRFRLSCEDGRAWIRFSSEPSGVGKPITACDLSAWSRFWGWLTGLYINLQEVSLVEERPDQLGKYSGLFEADVKFGQRENAFCFSESYLKNPLVHNQGSIEEFLSTVPYHLIAMPGDRSTSIASRVRHLIGRDFSRPFPSYERVADMLHMSSTTLRRRLAQEGTSYQQLKDRARRDAAISYLSDERLSINSVADLMGFVDPSSFNRTFKRWTGVPPGVYRDRYLNFGTQAEESVPLH